MTKFEQVGVNYQHRATSIEDANKSFEYSCNCCCNSIRCMYKDCEHCAIAQTHNLMVAILTDKEEK